MRPIIKRCVVHEVSIALSLLEIIEKKCREEGYQRVQAVRVKVGKASGILPEAFSFALDAIKRDTLAREARFVIDLVPLGGTCHACGKRFETEEPYIAECPFCNSQSFRITQGNELEIVEMEVE